MIELVAGNDDRGVAPAVGKALEAGIVVLFVALLTATLYGGVVPDARTAAAAEVGERALQHAASNVEAAVPEPDSARRPANGTVVAERRVTLPETICDRSYRITADGGAIVLVHPNSRVGGRTPLVLSDRVQAVRGNWTSNGGAAVRVRSRPGGGLVVELVEEGG